MHVAEFLDALALTPDIEVVEATLPYVRFVGPELALGGPAAFAAQNAAGETLLDDLHHRGRRAAFGFADQQMNVLGHDDISNDHELVALADLPEFRATDRAGGAAPARSGGDSNCR